MAKSLWISLIGAASMAAAFLVGCGDDDAKPVSSKLGDSCVRTSDCASGLSCISNVCYKVAPTPQGGAGGGSSKPPMPPMLGGEGESCTSRLDCADGLGCFNNRCTASNDMGEGGAPSVPPVNLGSRGESCRVNGDCGSGLVCVPASAAASGGVCDTTNYGIQPTGMKCSGECLTAADCCQLPLALQTADVKSCEDIASQIKAGPVNCRAPATPAEKTLCFELATYCECSAKTWACDEDTHACVYNTACVVAAGQDVPTGCPSYSRLHSLAALTCNADSKRCEGPSAAPAACTTDAKCVGQQVFDSVATDLCTADECTCYAGNKQCYRKCTRDIDCGAGMACDTDKTNLCVPSGTCTTDSECAIAHGSVAYKCNEGSCKESCKTDRDCSPSGLIGSGSSGAFNGSVCGADGFCASVALDCREETQCAPAVAGGLKPFCVKAPPAAGSSVASAITD